MHHFPQNPSSETHMYACTYLQEREWYLPKNDPRASVFIRWAIDCITHNTWAPSWSYDSVGLREDLRICISGKFHNEALASGPGTTRLPLQNQGPPGEVSCRLWSPLPTFLRYLCPNFHSAMASKLSQLTSLTDVHWSHSFQAPSSPSWLFSHFLPKEQI